MLHSAPVPVVLTPRGYRPSSDARLSRVTCAFAGSTRSRTAFDAAVQLAICGTTCPCGSPPSLFATTRCTRQRSATTPSASSNSSGARRRQEAQKKALAQLPDDVEVEAGVVGGRDWEDALDSLPWEEGEVLVVGSSRLGPVTRVFLGSNSTKIVRSSPVPVLVIPRGADVHLEDAASTGSQEV